MEIDRRARLDGSILVTGVAGFIGFHLALRLLREGVSVTGLDNLNDYYDVELKWARLAKLFRFANFNFIKLDIVDETKMRAFFSDQNFDHIVHLAAQVGVRGSVTNPHAYVESNVVGFVNLLEGARHANVRHLVFASSSSVYGANQNGPFSESDCTDYAISLYAATKKANEVMAHAYARLHNLRMTGLRFFTVYGPWGRPDMAYFLFTKAIIEGKPIDVFNHGEMLRDFTYIDDVVEGIVRVLTLRDQEPPPYKEELDGQCRGSGLYRIYNIGNSAPVSLSSFIEAIEAALEKQAVKRLKPMEPGDVPHTFADVTNLMHDTGFRPSTSLRQGIRSFVEWYRMYYQVETVL